MLGAGGFLGMDRRSRGSRLEAVTVLLVRITQHSLSYKAEIVAWRSGGSPGSVPTMAQRKHDPGPPMDLDNSASRACSA